MTIVETRPEDRTVFEGRTRRRAAALLLLGPLVMIAASGFAAAVDAATNGADDLDAAVAQPALAGWSVLFGLLTPPAMLASGAVLLLATRRWAPRSAWTGFVAMVLQLFGLASVVGIELLAATLASDGVPRDILGTAMDEGLPGTLPGVALLVMFLLCLPIAFAALGIALWATRWVPRWVPIVFWVLPFADLLSPEHPKWIHTLVFVALLAAFGAVARGILRDGAPTPVEAGQTA
jgi:hypothetical protein